MIRRESLKSLNLLAILLLLCVTAPASAQLLQPEPPILLINSGYGARALGMAGAFGAIANDLSTVYWNPGGLAQLEGIQFHVDYRHMGDSDEDIAQEVEPTRFVSQQRYAIKGNQLQSISGSYAFPGRKYAFVPAFSWQRLSTLGPERDLKEPASVVEFLDPQHTSYIQSQGNFNQEFKGGEEEYAFALGVRLNPRIMFGGSWSFLHGGIDNRVNGDFHDDFIPGTNQPAIRTDYSLQQSQQDDLHGNYLKLGALFSPTLQFKFGGYVRLPYTRSSDVTLTRKGNVTSNGIATPLNESATAHTAVDVPTEWGGAIAIRTTDKNTIGASITYANWQDVVQTTSNSTDPVHLPEGSLPFPTLRANAGFQNSVLQLRLGTEYMLGGPQGGLALRIGWFRDGQPYDNANGDRAKFKGYSFGAGFVASSYRLDVAYIRETGNITFTDFSSDNSSFTNARWVFSLDLIGK